MAPGVGVVLLVVAACLAGRSWLAVRPLVRDSAVVTEEVSRFAPGGSVLYAARLRLRLPSGRYATFVDDAWTEEASFAPGESVPVVYAAGQPESAKVATVWRLYWLAILVAVCGVAVFDLGWVVRRLRRSEVFAG